MTDDTQDWSGQERRGWQPETSPAPNFPTDQKVIFPTGRGLFASTAGARHSTNLLHSGLAFAWFRHAGGDPPRPGQPAKPERDYAAPV